MSAVVEAVSNVVESVVEAVGDVAEPIVQAAGSVVDTVANVAENVVQGAVNDPIGTIAKVGTAIFAPEFLPLVSAGDVVAHGGDIGQAALAAGTAYLAPEVGGQIGGALEGSAIGDALASASEATGIENLPSAAARGLGQAVTQTGAGLIQGQDIGDALTRGLTAGVGSTVGGVAAGELDTGNILADNPVDNAPTNALDRILGGAAGAATTAALRGKDAGTALENALASGIMGTGINALGQGIASLGDTDKTDKTLAELPTATENVGVQLADTGSTATDVGLTPTEEAVKQLKESSVTVYDPETGLPVQKAQTPEEEANLNALIAALYPETQAQNVARVDESGNAYDKTGQLLGFASDFGLSKGEDAQGNAAWITPAGETIAAAPIQATQEIQPAGLTQTDATALDVNALLGDQAGDYPEKIINNPDGSTTVIEADGTQRIFNVDGSVTLITPDGTSTEEFAATPETPAETPSESSSSSNDLSSLASALLTPITGSLSGRTTGGSRGTTVGGLPLGALAGIGAGIGAGIENANSPTTPYDGMSVGQMGFNWNGQPYQPTQGGIAYGQRFLNPTYTPITAADGGLMSVASKPQFIQPTLTSNGISSQSLQRDPTNSVQMYAHGGLSSLGNYSDGGRMLKGPGDGMSDDIPATIAGHQPARLANEEFVIPADVVSHLGNGSSEAGAKVLYAMMDRVRKARTGHTRQGKRINPDKLMPR